MASPSVSLSVSATDFTVSGSWNSSLGAGNTLVSRSVTGPDLSSSAASGSISYVMTPSTTYTWSITLTVYNASIGENQTVSQSQSLTAPSTAVRLFDGVSSWAPSLPYVHNGSVWQPSIAYVYNGSAWVACV